ncbi:MAG TPA: hypothetical protein VGO85_08365 [Caldimonas sp.]|jgi:hypothetical protein|nr:hypothetical protein [Caldimonas sp.]
MQTRARHPGVRGVAAAIALGSALPGCSPVFDWREARPEGSGVVLMFPCRPVKQERSVRMGAAVVPMQLHSCSAGGATFLLDAVDVADPAQVAPVMAAFRTQAATNLGGAGVEQGAFAPPGATPNPQSARIGIVGTRPDGRRVVAQAAFFVKGLRLYQATVLGGDDAGGREAVDTFFGAIRLP